MDEFQLWSTMNGGLMANAVYQAGVFFLLCETIAMTCKSNK